MLLALLLAFLHLLALGIGLGAVWIRARALRRLGRGGPLEPVFTADTWWITALALWLVTGLVRAIAGLEQPDAYYLQSGVFWAKMAVFAVIFVIELWPMTAILQWGFRASKGREADTAVAPRLAAISYVQAGLVVMAVALAVMLARGA